MQKMEKMKRMKNGYVIAMLALFLFALAFSGWRNCRRGIFIGDDFFYKMSDTLYKSGENMISLQKNGDATQYSIQLNGEKQSAVSQWNGDRATVTYEDGTVIAGAWNEGSDWGLYGEDGVPLAFTAGNGITITVGDEAVPIGKTALANALCRIDRKETESRGSLGATAAGAVLYLIGALIFLYPNEAHFLFRKWAYQQAELSDAGLFMEKSGGIVVMIAGLAIMTGIFFY